MKIEVSWPRKKLSCEIQLAALLMVVTPTIALADLEVSGVVSAATSVTNSGTVLAGDDLFQLEDSSLISGDITNQSGSSLTSADNGFVFNNSFMSGDIINSGNITANDRVFRVDFSSIFNGGSDNQHHSGSIKLRWQF